MMPHPLTLEFVEERLRRTLRLLDDMRRRRVEVLARDAYPEQQGHLAGAEAFIAEAEAEVQQWLDQLRQLIGPRDAEARFAELVALVRAADAEHAADPEWSRQQGVEQEARRAALDARRAGEWITPEAARGALRQMPTELREWIALVVANLMTAGDPAAGVWPASQRASLIPYLTIPYLTNPWRHDAGDDLERAGAPLREDLYDPRRRELADLPPRDELVVELTNRVAAWIVALLTEQAVRQRSEAELRATGANPLDEQLGHTDLFELRPLAPGETSAQR